MRNHPAAAPLDRIDHLLVAALQHDARRSNKELAALVGLAPSSCLARVRRLRAAGVLRGAHAEIAPAALGIELQALIAIELRRHAREEVESFRAHVRGLREVVAVYHLAGEHDFLVHVAVPGTEALRNLALDAFTARPEVARLHTWLIFDATRAPALPDYAAAADPADGRRAAPRGRATSSRARSSGRSRRTPRRATASS